MEPNEPTTGQNPLVPENPPAPAIEAVPTPVSMPSPEVAPAPISMPAPEVAPSPVATPAPAAIPSPEVITPPTQSAPEVMEFAGFGRRLVALIVDWFVIGAVMSGINMSILASANGAAQVTVNEYGELVTTGGSAFILIQLISFVLTAAYFIYFTGSMGQTLGKKLLGIRVVTTSGDQPSYGKAVIRYVMSIVSGAIFLIGYLAYFFNKEKQTWHDKVADTYVVKAK